MFASSMMYFLLFLRYEEEESHGMYYIPYTNGYICWLQPLVLVGFL